MSTDSTSSPLDDECSASYMTPYATVFAMTGFYLLAIIFFCKNSKKICFPISDSMHRYSKRLKQLERNLKPLLIDEEGIEVDDFQIGQSNSGFVFRGAVFPKTQNRFNARVTAAVKISFPTVTNSMNLLEDALKLSKLDHPHIIRLLGVSTLSFSVFRPMIALEWLPGGTLADYFLINIRSKEDAERPTVLLKDMIAIFYQISDVLNYIHSNVDEYGQEMSHGRIMSRNVLLTERNLKNCQVKLGDFGEAPTTTTTTAPSTTSPLVAYLPPEIVCCTERIPPHRPENDVWMFGVFMWECLTLGSCPHYRKSVEDIKKSFRLPDRGLPCPPTVPLDVWKLVMDCLSDAHVRPRFVSTSHHSIPVQLSALHQNVSPTLFLYPIPDISSCTCVEHRCNHFMIY